MTELIWEGKYVDGRKATPVRIALPFQTIETVNESNADREKRLGSLFQQKEESEWRNRLIWGDKKYVLPSLLPEFAGRVNLIYIDPPFNVGADFSFTAKIADDPETEENEAAEFVKQPSMIEQKAYRDTWGRGLDSYMQWFYETALLLRELLADDGSIYVHVGWQVSSYIRAILDEVFGGDGLRNELVWQRFNFHADAKRFGTVHETIWYYVKSDEAPFEKQFAPVSESLIKSHYSSDSDGRLYTLDNPTAPAHGKIGKPMKFGDKLLHPPKGAMWRWKQENIDRLWSEGKVVFNDAGMPRVKRYLDEIEGTALHSIWTDVRAINSQAIERVSYPTQKPEALLERIIKASSNEGDLVLDCFCGSGTTAAVAEKLGRRWITCDLGRFAIHTARKRLLGIDNVKPFVVQNLGKYERQQWMNAEFERSADTPVRMDAPSASKKTLDGGTADEDKSVLAPSDRLKQEREYRHFIIELYHAKALDGYTWLHGAKAGRMVHIGSVEAPVTVEDIKATIKEFWKMAGGEKEAASNGIDFLGWDFAFDVNETAAHFASANNVNASFKKIPREVLEKKAVDAGDIKFYELAALSVGVKTAKKQIEITLKDFIIPPDDVPEEIRGKITHWSQWIDYWAVDWNFSDDTFHNEWQSYRTKKEPKIDLTARNTDVEPGKYTVVVKVIDILGNDTTKAVAVEVKR
ncbi:MAG: site-specific DNA-methyltransferase [Pyrinomonadaceae bacterium]